MRRRWAIWTGCKIAMKSDAIAAETHMTIDTTGEDPDLVAAIREAQQTLDQWHDIGCRLGVPA